LESGTVTCAKAEKELAITNPLARIRRIVVRVEGSEHFRENMVNILSCREPVDTAVVRGPCG
jgi:hypothetical protein